MADFPHLLYTRNPEKITGFRKTRGRDSQNQKEETKEEKPISEEKKGRLLEKLRDYDSSVQIRLQKKTLNVPSNFDLIQIDFHTTFDKSLENHFYSTYGLEPIEKFNFNKTILFNIIDSTLFLSFSEHINIISNLKPNEDHRGKPFSRIALISNFNLLDSSHRKGILSGKEGYFLSICDVLHHPNAENQLNFLLDYLQSRNIEIALNNEKNLAFINGVDTSLEQILVDNFDVIRLISSARVPLIKPGTVSTPIRSYGFGVNVKEDLPIVCIIDTGVQNNIEPLKEILTDINIDHTGNGSYWDEAGHGTAVAGCIAFGADFFDSLQKEIDAKAKIAVLKVIHQTNDDINIVTLLEDIKELYLIYRIRIFNISLNLPGSKQYNSSIGRVAYELDKLSYELDILIINSVGNYLKDDLDALILLGNLDIQTHYPSFFYRTNPEIEFHFCELTNIQEPSEAMNILSVGALAGNFEDMVTDGITPAKEYPAFYTRKFHWDHEVLINGKKPKDNQFNKHLNKPDLVFEGGDYLSTEAAMEVLTTPFDAGSPYFGRLAGTSIAAPLISSMVAELVRAYPFLNMVSIKALLINQAESPAGKNPVHFNSRIDKKVYRRLTGHGRPNPKQILENDENTITFIIEDNVSYDDFYSFNLQFPDWVLTTTNKIEVTGTLVFKFQPVPNNQLAYLPLHISFGIFKPLDINTLSQQDLEKFQLKSGVSWAEDHFGVEDRVFSNVQKISFNLSSQHFQSDNPNVAIAIRCFGKSNIPEAAKRHLKENLHEFSLVIRLREIRKNKKAKLSGSLYNEVKILNELELISDLEAGASLDGGI
ncbi:S8 family peptidase [Mongoliitalea daihaiensis]|uniref:S8 family peptidase n=1 Tax=Mongoliitalea daihaiensis TaxID=2782006 RepID=UPI001F297920|nr:S8 family peptidase [Mongoliitalea daihaiensis]UJP65123.1 S8 family peptidase [Mongoliitalea daihaiensis]